MSPNAIFHAFHFLRPLWLLALPVLWGLVFWLAWRRERDADWSGLIDAQLLPALRLEDAGRGVAMRPWALLALAWSLAVLALAGPSWQQDQTEAYRAPASWVFVLDLSPSMAATDIAPDRATRARYALVDLLGAARDARVGLVVFSDEPYTVTPLTQDTATVQALLTPLAPDIMPSSGDHLAPALDLAEKLLQAQVARDKRIVLLTDGFDDPAASFSSAAALKARGVSLNVVGMGTPGGSPLPGADGSFAQDAQGHTLLARLDIDRLKQLATAGGGRYLDIAALPGLVADLQASSHRDGNAIAQHGIKISSWRDAGSWILPLLLLTVAFLARRGWL